MGLKSLVIVGPTAVGKTALSIRLAQYYHGEIISGDSMQVYQGLDIGTAKISKDEMQGIKHFLIDEIPVTQRFSVADFVSKTRATLSKVNHHHYLPILVGGTGFYLQSLIDDYQFGGGQSNNNQLRQQLQAYGKVYGAERLWERLNEVDPHAAAKIPPANQQRVIRALEVYQRTGKLFSEQHDHTRSDLDFLVIGLNTERKVLYRRINQRVDQMLDAGLLDEAYNLYRQGGIKLPAGKGIGYKEFYPYFTGDKSLAACIDKVKQNSRHYAKRQLTWFRNKMNVHWFDLVLHSQSDYPQIIELVNKWLKRNGIKSRIK